MRRAIDLACVVSALAPGVAGVAAVVAAVLTSGVAAADAPSAEAMAQTLFEEARGDLRRSDFAAAYPKLVESERIDPSNGTLLNLVVCEDRLRKTASAWAHAKRLVDQLPDDDDRKPVARRELADLDARLPRLTIHVRGAPPTGAVVTVDGTALAPSALGTSLPLDPGDHELRASSRGEAARSTTITLGEGQHVEWVAELPEPATAGVPAPEPALARHPPRWSSWAALGVGAAGLVAGTVLGALAMGKRSQVQSDCPDKTCRDPTDLDAASAGQRLFVGSAIALGVGAAATGAGVYLMTRPDGPRAPAGALATVSGTF
jgi:hypothetical protein